MISAFKRPAFTLIEVLIVLIIIAVIMISVAPIALNAVSYSKETQVASNLKNIETAVESFVLVEKSIPNSMDDLQSYLTNIKSDYSICYGTKTEAFKTIDYVLISYTGENLNIERINKILPEATNIVDWPQKPESFKFGIEHKIVNLLDN